MQRRAYLDGADIEFNVQGSGEPLLLIHGAIIADGFRPVALEPAIAEDYRVISYHRRGYVGSSRLTSPITMHGWAAEAAALLRHLDVLSAHVAGHSYGGGIALQLTLDAPGMVHSLALLEPPLLPAVPSGPQFSEWITSVTKVYETGDKVASADAALIGVFGPNYRQLVDGALPPGAFDLGVADIDTFFQFELEALQNWNVTADDVGRLRQPVLSMLGGDTLPIFGEVHDLIKQRVPQAEGVVVPNATHALPLMEPGAVADGLAGFFARHKF